MSLLPGTIHMTALVNPPPAQQTAAGAPVNTGHGPFAGLVAELQLLVTTPGQAQTPPGIAANANEVPDVAASPPDSLPAAVTPDDPARPPGAAESTPRATKYDHPLTGMGDADDAPVDHAPASPALSVAAPYGMHAPRNITATAHARPSAQILPREQQSRDEALPLADAGERIPSLTRPPEREDAATDRPSSPVEMPVAGEAPLVLPIPYAVALDSARPAPVAKIGMPPPDLLSPTGTLPGETVAPREQAHGAPVMRAVPPAQHATPQTGFGHTPASPPVSTASSAVAAPDRPPLGVMPDQHLPAPPPQPVSGALTPPTPLPTPSDHPLLPENVALMHDAPVPLPQHPARTAAPTGAVWHATVVPGEFLAAHPVEHLPDARAATATALALPAEVTALAVGQLQEKTPPRAVEDVFPAEDMPAVIREPGENSSHGLRRTIMAVQTLVQEPEGGTRQEQRDAALAGSDVSVPHERFAERDRAHQAAQRAGRSPAEAQAAVTALSHQQLAEPMAARPAPMVDTDALLRQVATQVRRVMPDMAPTITVRLDPPELGALRITIQAQHGEVLARIESPHQAVCAALDQRLPELRQVLEDAGIRVSACQVSVNTQAGREGPPSQWQLPQQGRQGWAPAASPPATGLADEAIMPQVVSGRARHTCVLDLFA